MRIHFASRPHLLDQPGGDSIHLRQTMQALQARGHEVALHDREFAARADLQHFFNLGRPEYLLPWQTQQPALPYVISTLYVQYGRSDKLLPGWIGHLARHLSPARLSYLKVLNRVLFHGEPPSLPYLIRGQRKSENHLARNASGLISATQAEAELVSQSLSGARRPNVISLGWEHFPHQEPTALPETGVVCVGRLEPLKNQLALIQACNKLQLPLHLVGDVPQRHRRYARACREVAGPGVSFHGSLPAREVAALLARYSVHALPSYFETTGLSSLEALVSGCRIVVSDHPIQRELWGARAHYCQPDAVASIAQALQAALEDPSHHRKWAQENFSWSRAAAKIEKTYQALHDF